MIQEEDSKLPKFTIHGLWPQYDLNNYPEYCKKVNFSIKKIEEIQGELNLYWCSDRGSNENFWGHEYLKHGSCMFMEMTELEYFQKALNLYHQAIKLGLPEKYYDPKTKKCLIPVTLDFKFKNY